jgi:pyruvate/2-oxoglutarate dehydrogenase complex dihydrolipoamide acyltransferase (E2) component
VAVEVLLPKLGLTMQEGTIEEWLVPAGHEVRPGEPILSLATDKVDVEVVAEAAGRLHPVVPAGSSHPPGAVIAWLLAAGEEPPAGPTASEGPPDAPVARGLAGDGAAAAGRPATDGAGAGGAPAARGAGAGGGPAARGAGAGGGPAARGANGRLFASPNARRVARAAGVDLATVRGSGPRGRIVSEDVEAVDINAVDINALDINAVDIKAVGIEAVEAVAGSAPLASPLVRRDARDLGVDLSTVEGSGPAGRIRRADVGTAGAVATVERVIPLTGMRGTIARRMHTSLHEMAQLTHGFEVGMDGVVALREQLKREWPAAGLAVPGVNDFIVLAAARALRAHPGLNASIVDGGIHLLRDIHVGFAVAVDGGLLVPVVRDAAGRGLVDLAGRVRELAQAARAGRLALADLEGATFVVTSLGGYGVDFFTPIINPGNVAILGVGRLRDGVRWEGETPRRSRVLTLSLTFDHRAVDGAPAAAYLQAVAGLLEQPLRLLANC